MFCVSVIKQIYFKNCIMYCILLGFAQFCNMFHITNATTDCANSSKKGRCKVPSGGQTM